tara:strand:- start:288 stop:524 length:237 start_codon:yes stop_codon:yes gene_type:complete
MNEPNLRLSNVQQKAIRALAKADARPAKQMLSMVLNEGFNWVFNEFSENIQPYQGWPEGWENISKELEDEYKKAMEVK